MLLTLWNFLDGKKTNIGAALASVMVLFSALGMIWGYDHAIWFPKVMETGEVLAGLFGGTGLIHKAVKATADSP